MKGTVAIAAVLLGWLAACSTSSEDGAGGPGAEDPDAAAPAADAGAAPDTHVPGDGGTPEVPVDPALVPVVCASEPCVVQIDAKSGTHACARRSDGKMACWGNGSSGQLGADPSTTPPIDGGAPFGSEAVLVAGLPPVIDVAVGGNGYVNAGTGAGSIGMNGNTCARTADGSVYCWGANGTAFEGVTRSNGWTPAKMPFPPAKALELGNEIVCVLDFAGVPVCSGGNEYGDVLVPSYTNTKAPRAVITGGGPCVQLEGSARNVLCVEETGRVYAWGFGRSLFPDEVRSDVEPSLLGRISSLEAAPAALVPSLANVTSVSASWSTACALSNGKVLCWGRGELGQLGIGVRTYQTEPQPVRSVPGDYFKQVAAGWDVTCAVTASGDLYCWGSNSRGQLGRTDIFDSISPIKLDGLPQIVQVAVLEESVCALAKSGEVLCWGANDRGQLARGTVDTDVHPDPRPITWGPAQ